MLKLPALIMAGNHHLLLTTQYHKSIAFTITFSISIFCIFLYNKKSSENEIWARKYFIFLNYS